MGTRFHAVLIDETRCEFGATVEAESRSEAIHELRDRYPECQVAQVESPEDTRKREAELYARAQRIYEGEEPEDFDW